MEKHVTGPVKEDIPLMANELISCLLHCRDPEEAVRNVLSSSVTEKRDTEPTRHFRCHANELPVDYPVSLRPGFPASLAPACRLQIRDVKWLFKSDSSPFSYTPLAGFAVGGFKAEKIKLLSAGGVGNFLFHKSLLAASFNILGVEDYGYTFQKVWTDIFTGIEIIAVGCVSQSTDGCYFISSKNSLGKFDVASVTVNEQWADGSIEGM